MAWYEDKTKSTYIATYKDEKAMRREVEAAAKFGWVPQGASGIGGHVNVGRTVSTAVLTGGVSLLFGASRSKDKTTVTFVRDLTWIARQRFDDALRVFQERQQRRVGRSRIFEHRNSGSSLVLARAGVLAS